MTGSDRERKLEELLAHYVRPMKNVPFEVVILGLYGVTVEKFDPANESNKEVLTRITKAMRDVCKKIQLNPIERSRPNEVGNDIEEFVIASLREERLEASPPKTKTGKGKAGYPDVKIKTAGLPIYLEVKTFSAANYDTTLRSFFLSPMDKPKVIDDAYHLLVGFTMVRKGNAYFPEAFEIADLYGLECDMKPEFNAHNRRLYESNRILVKEQVDSDPLEKI